MKTTTFPRVVPFSRPAPADRPATSAVTADEMYVLQAYRHVRDKDGLTAGEACAAMGVASVFRPRSSAKGDPL